VEVRRRYSNPPDQARDQVERLRRLLDMVATMPPDNEIAVPIQLHRRLREEEAGKLVAGYLSGTEVGELAERYGCH